MKGTPACVLDSSALLAYLWDEPGTDTVELALQNDAAISAVNWTEVLSKLADAGNDPDTAAARMLNQGAVAELLLIWAFDADLALDAARLRAQTRPFGLSLGDRACLALGSLLNVPVLTADSAWAKLKTNVAVQTIR